MWNNNLLFVISGPSGSGKTTLLKELLREEGLKSKVVRSVSFTTRPRRPGERGNRDYFFIATKEFRSYLKEKKILEWTQFLNYYYGTLRHHLERLRKQKRHILLCLDERGAARLKALFPNETVTIFILPPKLECLKERMAKPEREAGQRELRERLKLARRQLRISKDYDYRIVNADFHQALKKLKKIILQEINTRRA